MSSTCFDPEGSSTARLLYKQSSTHYTAHTNTCKTYRTITVYTAV